MVVRVALGYRVISDPELAGSETISKRNRYEQHTTRLSEAVVNSIHTFVHGCAQISVTIRAFISLFQMIIAPEDGDGLGSHNFLIISCCLTSSALASLSEMFLYGTYNALLRKSTAQIFRNIRSWSQTIQRFQNLSKKVCCLSMNSAHVSN